MAIRDYIARDSVAIAGAVIRRIVEAVAILRDSPDAGRVVPERADPSLRELIQPPYRIVYERRTDALVILTVFHAARLFPTELR
jgi:plasmid stabilization system protein ParE